MSGHLFCSDPKWISFLFLHHSPIQHGDYYVVFDEKEVTDARGQIRNPRIENCKQHVK